MRLKEYINESIISDFFQRIVAEGEAELVRAAILIIFSVGAVGIFELRNIISKIHRKFTTKRAMKDVQKVEEFLDKYPALKDENSDFQKTIVKIVKEYYKLTPQAVAILKSELDIYVKECGLDAYKDWREILSDKGGLEKLMNLK